MDSAAARVFGIPELLEPILIFAVAQHRGLEHLFVLQRVNRSFHGTIKESVRLRRSMCIEHSIANSVADCWYFRSRLLCRYLSTKPFKVARSLDNSLYCTRPGLSDLFFRISSAEIIYHSEMGVRQGNHILHGATHTWRKVKLTNRACPITVHIGESDPEDESRSMVRYGPVIELGEGMNFGELIDVLESVTSGTRNRWLDMWVAWRRCANSWSRYGEMVDFPKR